MITWLKKVGNTLLFGLNVFFGLLLLGAYLATWVPPSTLYLFSLFAIAYPFLLFVQCLFLGFWIYRRKRYVYLPLLLLLLGWNPIQKLFGFNGWQAESLHGGALTLMSYNAHYFRESSSPEAAKAAILSVIDNQVLDVLCGQEFTAKTAQESQAVRQALRQQAGLRYSTQGGGSSLAIFSRHPIVKQGTIQFPDSYNGALYADVQKGAQLFRVYCFHLQSVGLGQDESEVFNRKNLATLNDSSTQKTYQRINNKLKDAFLRREEQVLFIAEHIRNSPYPVLVAGDMNDTPMSYAYAQLTQGLTDAFVAKGWGFGTTYAGRLPLLRIDYIFTSSSWSIRHFSVLHKGSSDHYPIRATVQQN